MVIAEVKRSCNGIIWTELSRDLDEDLDHLEQLCYVQDSSFLLFQLQLNQTIIFHSSDQLDTLLLDITRHIIFFGAAGC